MKRLSGLLFSGVLCFSTGVWAHGGHGPGHHCNPPAQKQAGQQQRKCPHCGQTVAAGCCQHQHRCRGGSSDATAKPAPPPAPEKK